MDPNFTGAQRMYDNASPRDDGDHDDGCDCDECAEERTVRAVVEIILYYQGKRAPRTHVVRIGGVEYRVGAKTRSEAYAQARAAHAKRQVTS